MQETVLLSLPLPQLQTLIVDAVNACLDNRAKNPSNVEADQLLTIEEAAAFAHLSKATLYGLVSRSEIPCMKKGKRLYFSKQELTTWIKSGRKKTNTEISDEADLQLSFRKKSR
jgi:excisionase family DNA binding protein